VDGSDILAVATSQAKSPHPELFWAQNGQLATRRGKWKLVLNGVLHDRTPSGGKMTGDDAVFLSNLDEDPGEMTNLRLVRATVTTRTMEALPMMTPREVRIARSLLLRRASMATDNVSRRSIMARVSYAFRRSTFF